LVCGDVFSASRVESSESRDLVWGSRARESPIIHPTTEDPSAALCFGRDIGLRVGLALNTRLYEAPDLFGHHSAKLGGRIQRSSNCAVGSYHELARLNDFFTLSLSNPRSQFFAVLNRDAVGDWEGKIVVGVSFSRVCITIGIAADDLDA